MFLSLETKHVRKEYRKCIHRSVSMYIVVVSKVTISIHVQSIFSCSPEFSCDNFMSWLRLHFCNILK